jgi:ribonuclease HII
MVATRARLAAAAAGSTATAVTMLAADAPKARAKRTKKAVVALQDSTVPAELGAPVAHDPMRARERALYADGQRCVVGVDEAGRGPLAGPVVAAACYIPSHVTIAGIADSKALSAVARELAFAELLAHPEVKYAVSIQPPSVIDEINILQATLKGMRESVLELRGLVPEPSQPLYVLVDGNQSPFKGLECDGIECETMIKGDSRCLSIAAASILAKVTRDRIMLKLDGKYPAYEFKQHKGYPTAMHVARLVKHGACPEHRRSFAPVRNVLAAAAAEEPGR